MTLRQTGSSQRSDDEKIVLPSTHIITPEVRLSFPALFAPKPRAVGSTVMTFQAVLLLPPGIDRKPFNTAMAAAMTAKWGKVQKLPPEKLPIRDCATKDIEGYEEGWHFINTHSRQQPGLVDQRNVVITDPNRIYAGCWVRAYINAFAWSHAQGGKGISFGLNALQFVRDDDRLDGRRRADEVFTPLEVLDDGEGEDGTRIADIDGEDLFG